MLIPTQKNVRSITDMRENALDLLNQVKKEGLVYIFYRSKPKAVMLDIKQFQVIREILDEYLTEKEAAKLAKEPRGKGIPLEEVARKYV